MDNDIFTTIVGLNNYEWNKVFKIGSIVRLVKEPDNDYDLEAIACESRYVGKTGYIANSTKTVTKGTMSAGRIYDKIDDVSFCEVKFVSSDSVIAKILTYEQIKDCRMPIKMMTFSILMKRINFLFLLRPFKS